MLINLIVINIFISQQGWSVRFVAAVAIAGLLLSAFPASFFVANAADEIGGDGSGGFSGEAAVDVCDNVDGAQSEVPTGYQADGSACYPISAGEPELVDITICKYEYDSGPLADWTVYLYSNKVDDDVILSSETGPEYTLKTEGEDGCVTQAVDPLEGPWLAGEEMQDGWSQERVVVTGGELNGGFCSFFTDADVRVPADSASEYRCDFYNVDERESVTGYKWNDLNNNGIHEEEEPGVSG